MRRFLRSKKKYKKIDWQPAPDIKKRVDALASELQLSWVNTQGVFCYRSTKANTRAYARIWGLGKIWQLALNNAPAYVIEVISEKFDKLDHVEQDKILIHEIAHIPKTFSGALLPHTRKRKGSFHDKLRQLIVQYNRSNK